MKARMRMMAISQLLFTCAVLSSFFSGGASAQEASADEGPICACSPSQFTFTLDLSLTCPPVDVTRNDGILATFCQISPFGDANQNIEDLTPVEVENINVLELGQNFQVLKQQNVTGVTQDGDVFDYQSVILEPSIEEIPKVIQVNIFARNANDEPIVNFFAISFTNDCLTYPTMFEGESAGWTHFTKLEAPPTSECPAITTESPTTLPHSDFPTESPTDFPTSSPTMGTTESPTDFPTDFPTFSPTMLPIKFIMSMDQADTSLEDLFTDTIMSVDMSMSMATLRLFEMKSGKKAKDEKSAKDEKYDKKDKAEKYEKYDKSAKSEKYDKKDKAEKYDKEEKSDKKEKRRRLRVRPLFEAI
eukprot:CAMPEP_0197183930 /NCGR_PEP_ID=MMETSP1423-20130617/8773_1 /TAXON_ID=476441 /ORGANISM="Pseudo-nitzschia heimii, Strain UNC1101" /LENGTH=359 /DNA_ID=CAMNT_0042634609 /DNA_START=179 /DNA_END=1258 /DNA_ORIENTATION=+